MSRQLLYTLAFGLMLGGCVNKAGQTSGKTPYRFLVGTYTKKGSEGIYVYDFDPVTRQVSQVSVSPKFSDPSFLVIAKDNRHVYAVSETDGGEVVALDFDPETGNFKKLSTVPSGGAHPCHITLDETGKWLFVGNYSGGNLSVIPVQQDGNIKEPVQTIQHTGRGPNAQRQEKSHVHSVNMAPGNKTLYVADLGTDKVTGYRFDAASGKLTDDGSVSVSPGSGPRHMAFHPDGSFVYVIQELTGRITAFRNKKGGLEKIEEVSTLPEGFSGNNACADLHISPDGRFLYGSNRFHDSMVIFKIDQASGRLTLVGHQDVLGKTPRNFSLTPDGAFVFVANQDTGNIVIFKRDQKTGKLSATGKEVNVSMPVCVSFLN